MLSLPKHLYHAAGVSNSNGVVEMLRQAQHDVLLFIFIPLFITSPRLFNTVLPYRFVQRNRNHTLGRESWQFLDIYKFFMHTPSSRRKYLVEVHAYADHLYTVDFYAKVRDINRYRLRTNQQAAGKLGGTVLAIMAGILRHDPQACFGFIAAALVTEASDANTKRFRLYKRMLELKINPVRHRVTTKPESSSIFVLPIEVATSQLRKQQTIARYEDIFRETF